MDKPVDAHFIAGTICKHCGRPVNDQGLAKVTHLTKCKPRPLLIWNGRGDYHKFDGRFYVCAPTKKLAVQLLKRAGHLHMNMREFTGYYSPAWGIHMEGVTREIGVWYDGKGSGGHDLGKPQRIL